MFDKSFTNFFILKTVFLLGFIVGIVLLSQFDLFNFPYGRVTWSSVGLGNILTLISGVISAFVLVYTAKAANAAASSAYSAKESIDSWQQRELYLKTVDYVVKARIDLLYLRSNFSALYNSPVDFDLHLLDISLEKNPSINDCLDYSDSDTNERERAKDYLSMIKENCDLIKSYKINLQQNIMAVVTLFDARLNNMSSGGDFPLSMDDIIDLKNEFLSHINSLSFIYDNIIDDSHMDFNSVLRHVYYRTWLFVDNQHVFEMNRINILIDFFDVFFSEIISESDSLIWTGTIHQKSILDAIKK